MDRSIANGDLATEGNHVAVGCQTEDGLETGGKSVAIRCLDEAITASGIQRKVLARECGWSEGQFSKVASGAQGDLFDLIYRLPLKHRAIRADFFNRLHEHEGIDPIAHAAELAAIAAIRLLRVCRRAGARMAKAELGTTKAGRVSA